MLIAGWASAEFSGARLPDERFRRTLVANAERLAVSAGQAFSSRLGAAGRQAAYRLFNHRRVQMDDLLAGHVQQTLARCAGEALVLCIQDTMLVDYKQHRSKAELGPISGAAGSRGLLVHSVLAASVSGVPLGLLGLHAWVRDPAEAGQAAARRTKPTAEKESRKWQDGLGQVDTVGPAGLRRLMIQDREGDVFDLLAAKRSPDTELLVRAGQDRCVLVDGQPTKLFAAAAGGAVVGQLTVVVCSQQGRGQARSAELVVRVAEVRVQPPQRLGVSPQAQVYTVVEAAEPAPPEGEEAVRWVLLTTLDLAEHPPLVVVEYYSRRWLIERWHYTLKSGLGLEQLQIDTRHRLENALAVLGVVAWRVLHLTLAGRERAAEPAAALLDAEELSLLRAVAPKPVASAGDVLREIARLGGYEPYRNAPPPGVKRVWVGLRRLGDMLQGRRSVQDPGLQEI